MILAASVALLAMAAPAAAQQYPPAEISCTISDTTVVVGEAVTISCTGFDPGSEARYTFFSSPVFLGTSHVNDAGHTSFTFHVPHVHHGPHHVEVEGFSNGHVVDVNIDIEVVDKGHAGGVTPGAGHHRPHDGRHMLARTGADTEAMLARVGAGLLAVGGVFVLVARKRRGQLAGASDRPESVDIP